MITQVGRAQFGAFRVRAMGPAVVTLHSGAFGLASECGPMRAYILRRDFQIPPASTSR